MSVTFMILMGPIGVLLIVLNKWPIIGMLGENNRMVKELKSARWFQSYWYAGLFLFVMNAVLFFLTGFLLFNVSMVSFVLLLMIIFAIIGSFFLWAIIHKAWQSTNRNRLKMAAIGSSFYVILTFVFIYWSVTLEPSYPGEDTFMRGMGLFLGAFITTVACISCFVFTGFPKKKAVEEM